MRHDLSRALGVLALLVLLLGALAAPRVAVTLQWRDLTPVARAWFDAGARGDSAALAELSVGEAPVEWARTTAATQDGLLANAARSARPAGGGRLGRDIVVLEFEVDAEVCPGIPGAAHLLQMQFLRAGERWLVSRVGIVPC